jgi:hypothetical protein
MPSTSRPDSPEFRALLHEKLDALLDECNLVIDNAKNGQVVHDLDDFVCTTGQNFLQEIYQQKLQEHIAIREKNTEAKQCSHCKKHSHPTVVTIGIETGYTNRLERLATRCCGQWSYRFAAETLEELCGVKLSHTTIGKIADRIAGELTDKMTNDPDVRQDIQKTFQQAKGETEFYADGVFVHIRNADGTIEWREMKVGALVKRLRGLFAFPSEWHTRKLPEPTAVYAFAAIVVKEEFQDLCQKNRRLLGVGGVSSALGDGAKWIWNVTKEVFGKTDECLDIYHGAEHISDCGKILIDSAAERREWFERMRMVLLSEGLAGMERELGALRVGLKVEQCKLVDSLLEYFRNNSERLNYCERLSMGRVIGSGLIEGACKNLVGRRLKQTGACWRLERANRIATVSSLLYSNQWKLCWKNTN